LPGRFQHSHIDHEKIGKSLTRDTIEPYRMNIEKLRKICLSKPFVTEDIKWSHDLCFMVGGKIFCITSFEGEFRYSVKTDSETFTRLIEKEGVIPAPYLARYSLVQIISTEVFSQEETTKHITKSYELVKQKLPSNVISILEQKK
jgi:predicted DNA-binding protein (MmcQ/YjbR family)